MYSLARYGINSNYSILDITKKGNNIYSLNDIFHMNLKSNLKFDQEWQKFQYLDFTFEENGIWRYRTCTGVIKWNLTRQWWPKIGNNYLRGALSLLSSSQSVSSSLCCPPFRSIWDLMTYFRVHESVPLEIILSQINPVHILFLQNHFTQRHWFTPVGFEPFCFKVPKIVNLF
jgi:hypothetical protein